MSKKIKTSLILSAVLGLSVFLLSGAGTDDKNATNTAVGAAALTAQSAGCAATLKNGSVLITGGHGASGTTNGAQVFSARNGAQSVAPMLLPREGHACAALADGRILVAGGTTNGGGISNSAEIYNPATGQWSIAGAMTVGRSGAAGVTITGGRILIAGGASNGVATSTLEVFDPAANSFRALPAQLSSPRMQHATVALPNGKVLIAGGANGAASLDTVDVFDPVTNTVTPLGRKLSSPRAGLSATVLLNGNVYFAGGSDGKQDLSSADLYNVKTGVLGAVAPMSAARSGHLAILVPNNNSVLIVGGNVKGGLVLSQELYIPWQNRYKPFGGPGASGKAVTAPGDLSAAADLQPLDAPTPSPDTSVLPTLFTDKPDYAPGETATISGSGWTPGSTITMTLDRDPATTPQTILTATADVSGNFSTMYLVLDTDLGVTFTLTGTSDAGDTAEILTFTDAADPTATTVSCSPNPVTDGSPTTCTATITNNKSGSNNGAPLGAVAFTFSGTGTAGSFTGSPCTPNGVPASNPPKSTCTATFTPTSIAATSITATYSSNNTTNSGWQNSVSATFSLTVNPGTRLSSTSVTLGTGTLNPGGTTTVSVTVNDPNPTAITPLGTVTLSSDKGDTFSGSCTLAGSGNHGDCSVTLTASATIGTHTITASYPGDANHAASSGTATLTVSSSTSTTTAVSSSTNPSTYGTSVAFTATITPNTATGTVQFVVDGSNFGGSVTVLNGSATSASTATLPAGNHTVAANFVGTGNFVNSSGTLSGGQQVNQASVTITASSSSVTYGDPVPTITAGFSAFQNGQSSSVLTSQPTCTTAYTSASNAGTTPSTTCSGAVAANYAFTYVAGSVTIGKASSTTTVTCTAGPFTYNGSAQTPCSASTTGAGGLSQSPTVTYLNNTNAGTASASASFAGDTNHNSSSDSKNFTIGLASSTTTVTCTAGPFTYNGSAETPCSASTTGVGGLSQSPTVTYLNNTNAGAASASASFAGDTNHSSSSDSKNFTIGLASSTTTLTCPAGPFTYNGSAQTPCSATVTGAGGLSQSVTVSYTNNTNAGTANASATFAGDTNHSNSSDSKNFTIGQATSTTAVTCPASVIYDGTAQTPCSATVTGAGSLNQSLTPLYTNNTNAGTAGASATFAGDTNHSGSTDSKNFAISQAPSTTTVTCTAGPFTYNSAPQTPCSATVTGAGGLSQSLTVNYTNNLNAGTATASASYAGDPNHTSSNDSKNFTIDKAPSTTAVTCSAGPFTYNGSAQTPCSALTTGVGGLSQVLTVNYTNNTNAGTATAGASFAGDTNHTASNDSKNFTIAQASSTTAVSCPVSVTYDGTAQAPCTASATGAGGLNQSLTISYNNNTNAGSASASATFAGDQNHTGSSDSKNFTIAQAPSVVTVSCPASVTYDGTAKTPCSATVTGASLSQSLSVSYTNNTNAGAAGASASYGGDANHTGNSDSKSFTIDKAPSTTTVTCSAGPFTYNGASQTPCSALATGVGNLSQTVTVTYTNNTDAGAATASASYPGDANHNSSSDSKNFTIIQAASTTSLTCPASVTYSGSPQTPCTATVTGAGSLNQAVNVTYSSNTNAGAATANANFPGDLNHTSSSDSKNFTINQASSTTAVTCPASVTFTGSPLTPCTAAVTGPGLSLVPSISYSNNTVAGTATASAAFAGDQNHTNSSDSKNFTINQAPSTTTVTCGAGPFTYNGSAQTPCTATVTGAGSPSQSLTVTYGNNTNAGTASASASYVGDPNHTSSSDIKYFTINRANVTASAGSYSALFDGLAHSPAACVVAGAYKGSLSCTNNPSSVGPGHGSGSVVPVTAGDTLTNFNITSTPGTWSISTIVEAGTVSVTPGEQIYTGNVVFNATLPVASVGGEAAATNVSFYICPSGASIPNASCQNMTPTPVALQLSGGKLTATTAPIALLQTVTDALSIGDHTVLAIFGGIGPDFNLNIPSTSLKIDQKAAAPVNGTTYYTGPNVYWTTSVSSSTATVFLSATLEDPCKTPAGGTCGNVTLAKVTFSTVNGTTVTPINGATNLPVGLVNATDPGVGTAAASLQYNLGNSNSATLTVRVTVSGYYAANSSSGDVQITVSKPLQANEMKFVGSMLCDSANSTFDSGAGNQQNSSNTIPANAGKCIAAPSSPEAGTLLGAAEFVSQFWGDITYSSKGSNPQGNIQATVVSYYRPDGSLDVTPHTYLIKSNAISTFAGLSTGVAQFTSKASIQDLTTGASVDGGALVNVTACADHAVNCPGTGINKFTAGGAGAIGIQVTSSKNGAVWFSSGWNGTQTVPRDAIAGNVMIN